jgi:hypothetical protein
LADVAVELALPRAEFKLKGKARAGIAVTPGGVPSIPSKRIMATVKIPF